jgi:hypothetical protein
MAENPAVTCTECVYWRQSPDKGGLCRRRAPDATVRAEQVAHWPHTEPQQGCGDGVAGTADRADACASCSFWRRYPGGMHPMNRGDMPNQWWAHAGLCMRHAPKPAIEPGPRGFWRATSESDYCGEGVFS